MEMSGYMHYSLLWYLHGKHKGEGDPLAFACFLVTLNIQLVIVIIWKMLMTFGVIHFYKTDKFVLGTISIVIFLVNFFAHWYGYSKSGVLEKAQHKLEEHAKPDGAGIKKQIWTVRVLFYIVLVAAFFIPFEYSS
ncbi:MAG: hypothetical protein K8F30_09500 [Taibaiella sp.]|nr:hypothetical protein [Taibaiella sp.]